MFPCIRVLQSLLYRLTKHCNVQHVWIGKSYKHLFLSHIFISLHSFLNFHFVAIHLFGQNYSCIVAIHNLKQVHMTIIKLEMFRLSCTRMHTVSEMTSRDCISLKIDFNFAVSERYVFLNFFRNNYHLKGFIPVIWCIGKIYCNITYRSDSMASLRV